MSPSGHLLKTFAAVPFSNRVLDLGCGHACHTVPLAQLGFEIHACTLEDTTVMATRKRLADIIGTDAARKRVSRVIRLDALGYPDAFFDWVVAYDVYGNDSSGEKLQDALAEARRVLKPGGWIYVAVPASQGSAAPSPGSGFTVEALHSEMLQANFALAEQPEICQRKGHRMIEGIYRRVDEDTPL